MSFDPVQAASIGEFIVAVSQMYNGGKGGLTPNPVGVPPGYDVHSYVIMNDFLPWKSMSEFYGFLATSEDKTKSIVAIRGTTGLTEWFDDACIGLVPFPEFNHCGSIEQGFGRIYRTIRVVPQGWDPHKASIVEIGTFAQQVRDAIATHTGATADQLAAAHSVIVAGHSLGAALVTLYVMENTQRHFLRTPLVYTFGSPRVGDHTFANTYDNLANITTWRIVNQHDLVPNIPPDTFGFVHVTTEQLLVDAAVRPTVPCRHSMASYMHLLDPARWSLESKCAL